MPKPMPTPTTFAPIKCADVTPTAVSWLWEPYLARGKLAVLDGDPGTGKSFVTVDLAARVSAGLPLPCGSPGKAGSVLLLNAEDDARDTIRPRLIAAGADPDRVRLFFAPGLGMEWWPRFPDDIHQLERAIYETAAALVVIDPMMAFLPREVSANNDQSVRLALSPLARLAAETDACILLVRHLRKSGGASAIYRGSGSIGIVGAVRTGLMIARHPDEPELRVFALSKTNIGPPGRSLGFRLERNSASGPTFVKWTGALDVTADDLFGASVPLRAGQRTRERAAEWLRAFLADGPRRAPEVIEAARTAGIPERTLNRVKAMIDVRSDAVKTGDKIEWWWRDPEAERARRAVQRAATEPGSTARNVYALDRLERLDRAEEARAADTPPDYSHVPMG